jgi:hypothetical protein
MELEKQIAELGVKLTEAAVRNTAGAISTKIQAAKAKKNDKETIQELEEIISSLISDRNELVQIAQAYEQEFVAQQISSKDIKYINDKFIPVIKDLLVKSAGGDETKTKEIRKTFDDFAPLLSVETLTVLQLLGFNFKKAVGEPLTILLQKTITAKIPTDAQTNAAYTKLALKYNTENLKVVQDEEASERFERFKSKGLM